MRAGFLLVLLCACSREPAIIEALDHGDEAVRAVADRGGDLDARDGAGRTALHHAAMRGDGRIVRLLVARGAKVDLRAGDDRTPLQAAAAAPSHAECVHLLLRAGADPNLKSGATSATALHLAVRHASSEVVSVLLRGGADANARDSWGETPLHAAARLEGPRAAEVARLLVSHGADPGAKDIRGYTPLHTAAARDNASVVLLWTELRRDLDEPSTTGTTALDVALAGDSVRAADALFRLGAKTATTRAFEPPLHRAARLDDMDRARRLLTSGADASLAFGGRTPLDVARAHGSRGVAALLTPSASP